MIDVSELMADPEFTRCFRLRRPRGAFNDDGTFVTTYRDSEMDGIIHPASPEQLQQLPEGTRLQDVIVVWSSEEMRAADGVKVESDVLIVDGKHYRVIRSEPWPDNGYFRVFAEGFNP